jgi:hypothetical protein
LTLTDCSSVEDQIGRLKHPVRVSILSDISGLSEAMLRKKIEQGKLRAFKRSGIILKIFLNSGLAGRTVRLTIPCSSRDALLTLTDDFIKTGIGHPGVPG